MAGPEDGPEAHCKCCFDWEQRVFALEDQIYKLKWALHIEVDGDHSAEECDCKDHMEDARKLLIGFKCPGVHCQGPKAP